MKVHTVIETSMDTIPTIGEEKLGRRRSIVHEFFQTTSTHGLPNIARSESKCNIMFWMVSFVCYTGIMLYFVITAILSYRDYPTNIDISYVQERPQYFPAVSICNLSPVRLDKFIEPFLNYTYRLNITNIINTTTISIDQIPDAWNFMIDQTNKNVFPTTAFFSIASMLYKCTYNGMSCSTEDFIFFTSPSYGACFTFNAQLKANGTTSVRYSNQYGGDGTLELSFYVHSHQYLPYVGNGIGMVASVHDNTQLPAIESAGIHLSPGERHKLGYKKKVAYFLPSPYTNCTNEMSPAMKATLQNYQGADYQYSETFCFQICQQIYIYEQCACVNPNLWNARSVTSPGTDEVITAPLCNITNSCYPKALNTLLSSASLMEEYCSDCAQQCDITTFLIQKSSLKAPFEWQMEDIKAFVENSSVPLPSNWSTTWRQQIYNNYVGLSVVRETNIVEMNIQSAKMSPVDLVSNIGGQTGLWIGISFLSVMELVEMIYRLIEYEFRSIRQRIERQNRANVQHSLNIFSS